MRRDQGIALLNALIMVAAISAVASGLMLRAETSRMRLAQTRAADQGTLYLDAAELLIPPVLKADWFRDQNVDHLSEGWARERFEADVDMGRVHGQLVDLQGRFNVNWLNVSSNPQTLRSFERLMTLLELPVPLAREVAGYVRSQGPAKPERYLERDLPVRPAHQPIALIEELRLVQGMTPEYYERLGPYVSALPPNTPLNVNTAPLVVLASLMPTASLDGINQLLVYRAGRPFANGGEFRKQAQSMIHSRVIQQSHFPGNGVATGSKWFGGRFVAEIDGTKLVRNIVVHRSGKKGMAVIQHRAAEVR